MITVIAHYTAAAGAADAVRQLLARHAAASHADPGSLQYAVPNDPKDPTTARGGNCPCTD
jgi:quinol monooxygenase YgiN